MQLHNLEQGRNNQNHAAKCEIGFLVKCWRRRITKKVIPKRLWYFGIVYEAEFFSRISKGKGKRTVYEEATGQTPDIGEYLVFEFYNLVWWWYWPDKPNATDDTGGTGFTEIGYVPKSRVIFKKNR